MKYVITLDRSGRVDMEFFYPDAGPLPPLVPGRETTAPSPGPSPRGPRRHKRGRVGRPARTGQALGPLKN